uniref:CSON012554 protein n=1 Tax=Culicoides sonorensis TaxID=179676 RepID=A0A336LKQ7_CULSO
MTNLTDKKICRFCLDPSEEKLSDIYEKPGLTVQVMSCVSIEMFDGDGMPKYVCELCRKLMEIMYNYKQICRKSEVVLKQVMFTGKVPAKFELPIDLIRNCVSEEKAVQKIDKETNTVDEAQKKVSKSVQTESEPTTIKKDTIKKTIKQKPEVNSPVVKKDSKETTQTKQYSKKRKIEKKVEENQIEILELTQAEYEKIPKMATVIEIPQIQVKSEIPSKPKILNKTIESTPMKDEKIGIESIVMTDGGNFQIAILDEIPESEVPTVYACEYCPKTYPLKQQLELHLELHFKERKYACDMCDNKFFTKNDLVKHIQTHTDKSHVCVVCNRTFARKGILRRHQLQHKDFLKFNCTKCPEKFITEEDLTKHTDFIHNKPRPFPCNYCEKTFAFKQGLERHMACHDPLNFPFSCEVCGSAFHTLSKLQQHLPKHAGKRRYPCKYCPKTFILSHHLSRHVRNAHTGIKPNRKFSIKVCNECNMEFQDQNEYIQHTAQHTTESLSCPLCKMGFSDMEAVNQHIELHTMVEEHFSCEMCSYAFLTEEQFNKHYQEVHGITAAFVKEEENYVLEPIDDEYEEVNVSKVIMDKKKPTQADIKKYFDKIPKSVSIKKKK